MKTILYYSLVLLCLLYANITISSTIFIIVHGTWGASESWYIPGGDFFDALEKSAHECNATVVPFRWSGKTHPDERKKAAQHLAKLIQTYGKDSAIVLIGHSYGGEICARSSHELMQNPPASTKQCNKIALLFTIGTPINTDHCPNMDIVAYCYNFFSLEDLIQPVCGMLEREYPSHERLANIRIFINGKQRGHTELHHPDLARWLPYFHDHFILHQCLNNKDLFLMPAIVYFEKNNAPRYEIDTQRQNLIDRDKRLSVLMIESVRNEPRNNPSASIE